MHLARGGGERETESIRLGCCVERERRARFECRVVFSAGQVMRWWCTASCCRTEVVRCDQASTKTRCLDGHEGALKTERWWTGHREGKGEDEGWDDILVWLRGGECMICATIETLSKG